MEATRGLPTQSTHPFIVLCVAITMLVVPATGGLAGPTETTPTANEAATDAAALPYDGLVPAIEEGFAGQNDVSFTEAIELGQLVGQHQATTLGHELALDQPVPDHDAPGEAAIALAELHDAELTADQRKELAELDAVDEPVRSALTDTIDAFIAFYLAADAAYGNAEGLGGHGGVFAARNGLLDAVADLHTALANIEDGDTLGQVAVEPYLSVDLDGEDNTYTKDLLLLIDAGGNDTYHNNAGGAQIQFVGQTVLWPASALVDLGHGNDSYGNPSDPRSGGVNGGAVQAAGFLLDERGNESYVADDVGVNGGVRGWALNAGGNGFLMDIEGADDYTAECCGANGGGDEVGSGALLDLAGDDNYDARSSGVNGGNTGGSGLLADLSGNDSYTAGWNGVNGEAQRSPSIALLFDGHGTDIYHDDEGGTGTDKTVMPKGEYGAQADSDDPAPETAFRDSPSAPVAGDIGRSVDLPSRVPMPSVKPARDEPIDVPAYPGVAEKAEKGLLTSGSPLGPRTQSHGSLVPHLDAAPLVVDDDHLDCPSAAFTSIQAAVDAAPPSATIEVCPGVYEESVRIPSRIGVDEPYEFYLGPGWQIKEGLTLQAVNSEVPGRGSDVILRGQGPQGANPTDEDPVDIGFSVWDKEVTIQGFTVENFGDAGIWYDGFNDRGDNGHILNNTVRNNFQGIVAHLSDGTEIVGNEVTDNRWYGMRVYGAAGGLVVKNNMMANNTLNFGGRPILTGMTLEGNTVDGRSIVLLDGIEDEVISPSTHPNAGLVTIRDGHNVTVRDMSFANNGWGVMLAYSTDSRIENVTANTLIMVGAGSNNTVARNTLTDVENFDYQRQHGGGIQVGVSPGSAITKNSVTGGTRGIQAVATGDIEITDNNVSGVHWPYLNHWGNTVSSAGISYGGGYGPSTAMIANNTVETSDNGLALGNFDNPVDVQDNTFARNGNGTWVGTSGQSLIGNHLHFLDNQVTENQHSGLVVDDRDHGGTPLVEAHGNIIEGNGAYGINNVHSNESLVVNATDNYWGASDGPSSPNASDPFADPVTGTLANGSGDAVNGNETSGKARVHFDPWLTEAPE